MISLSEFVSSVVGVSVVVMYSQNLQEGCLNTWPWLHSEQV